MTARILVAYTSRKGSTAGIAQAVGKELVSAGHTVDVIEMKTVTTVEGYTAVIIGAPVYMGKVDEDISKFVAKNRDRLASILVAAFAVGIAPVAPQIEPVEKVLEDLTKALRPIIPVALTVFAGKLDPDKMSFIEWNMTSLMKVRTGDFRDWNAIAASAKGFPEKLNV
jgi:menaquinone-dependent protoporphyrinogen oxidase